MGSASTWLPRAATVALFIAFCALVTWWALRFSAMNTIAVPKTARIAQTEAVETGAVATLFGGTPQSGVRDVRLLGVVAELGSGTGAAIVSIDGGPPKAVRAGGAISPQIRLAEIRGRAVVIERDGVRQEIILPAEPVASRGPPRGVALPATPPAGAAAPLSTPMPVPQAVPSPPTQAVPANAASAPMPQGAVPVPQQPDGLAGGVAQFTAKD
jgi:general secretion pathway protein C